MSDALGQGARPASTAEAAEKKTGGIGMGSWRRSRAARNSTRLSDHSRPIAISRAPQDGLAGSRDATYFFTSGQVDCDSGWKASSAGMVATSL